MGKLNQVPYVPQECGYNRITTVHTEERLSISSTESLSSLSACTVGDLDTGLDNDPTIHRYTYWNSAVHKNIRCFQILTACIHRAILAADKSRF